MAGSPISEAEEIALLDRVLGKLAFAEDDALAKVVENFLVPVLGKLSSPNEGTKKKAS
jgi:hypothetical protein